MTSSKEVAFEFNNLSGFKKFKFMSYKCIISPIETKFFFSYYNYLFGCKIIIGYNVRKNILMCKPWIRSVKDKIEIICVKI